MKLFWRALSPAITSLAVLALLVHGPIAQFEHYHKFADVSTWAGVPHVMDVLSNTGFALVAIYGFVVLQAKNREIGAGQSFAAYTMFVVSLAATAVCSTYYHLAPDDARLFWDRLPIALACCSLLAAAWAEYKPDMDARRAAMGLSLLLLAGLMSVVWWQQTGDLRPYLLMQGLALTLIPIRLLMHDALKADRKGTLMFTAALGLYVVAKITELLDAQILQYSHFISGHSLKHLLAALAAGLIVYRWQQQKSMSGPTPASLQKIEVYRQTAS